MSDVRRLGRILALLVFACVLPLWLSGCMKAGGATAAPAEPYGYDKDYGDYGGGGGGGEYDNYEEGAAMEAPPAPEPEYERMVSEDAGPSRARASRSVARKQKDVFKADARTREERPGSTDTVTTGAESSGEPEPLDVDVPDAEPAPAARERQIIYTATMQVSVYDVDAALELVESLPDRFGGWMQQRVDNQVVLRIPAEKLEQAMALVAELGVVDYRLLEALDVTAEYTDLESRIRVLEQMQAQLQALLAKAKDVEQALEIRKALDAITLELEAARAQMRELAKSVAFSTLILRLVERGPTRDVPSSNDPFPWVDELGVEATDYR